MKKVLILATSIKTRGGISSVCKAMMVGKQWKDYNCFWLSTHQDIGGVVGKCFFFIKSFIEYLFIIRNYDLIHIHIGQVPSAIRKCPFMFIAKLLGKKTIVHYHAFSAETTIKSKLGWPYKYLFNKADKIIVLSKSWKKEVENLYGLDNKCIIVYNPCPAVTINKNVKKEKYILYAGTICKRKGYSDLIIAFAKIARKYPDWKIFFAGNGEIKQGYKLAHLLKISSQVIFLGWIKEKKKNTIFNRASIFCLPSYQEGFPMAVLDAWAYSLPVITTPVGGILDKVVNGKEALLFKPGDINKLSELIEKLIIDTNLRKKLSEESKKLSETIFNIETFNYKISKIYFNVLL